MAEDEVFVAVVEVVPRKELKAWGRMCAGQFVLVMEEEFAENTLAVEDNIADAAAIAEVEERTVAGHSQARISDSVIGWPVELSEPHL